MKTKYIWTNRLILLLACLALITFGLHIYANWNISSPWLYYSHGSEKVFKFIMETVWFSSVPVFTFFILTAIAGFWRKRIYLPLFFIFFFWLGGSREFQEIGIAWNDFSSFGAPFTLVAWFSILMVFCSVAATISWIAEYILYCRSGRTK